MDFVEYYYDFLPDDTDTAWSLLSPEAQQAIGSGSFRGFWATVDAVQVDATRPDGPDGVVVTLTYTTDRGTEQETRRLHVGRAGGGYLITADDGAISG
jgi:hypothetical protein